MLYWFIDKIKGYNYTDTVIKKEKELGS